MIQRDDLSMSLTPSAYRGLTSWQKIFSVIGYSGLLIGLIGTDERFHSSILTLTLSLTLISAGILGYSIIQYRNQSVGIQNNFVRAKSFTTRGIAAWFLALTLMAFYILLYFFPASLGLGEQSNTCLLALFDPLSYWIK